MKLTTSVFAAAVLISGPALAQSFSTGQKVQAMNADTGKLESATITRIDGDRYLLHSDNASVSDWDVAVTDLRASGSASATTSSSSTPATSTLANGSPAPIGDNTPPPNSPSPPANDNPPADR